MTGFPGSWPRPFAVGVLVLSDPDDRARHAAERLELALDAYKYGYFLLDIVEAGPDGAGYLVAEALAARAGADAFVVRGPVDQARLAVGAARHRLVVRTT